MYWIIITLVTVKSTITNTGSVDTPEDTLSYYLLLIKFSFIYIPSNHNKSYLKAFFYIEQA